MSKENVLKSLALIIPFFVGLLVLVVWLFLLIKLRIYSNNDLFAYTLVYLGWYVPCVICEMMLKGYKTFWCVQILLCALSILMLPVFYSLFLPPVPNRFDMDTYEYKAMGVAGYALFSVFALWFISFVLHCVAVVHSPNPKHQQKKASSL